MPPYSPETTVNQHLLEGQQLCRMGRFSEAMALYARVMTLAPHRLEPYLNCGEISLAEGRYEDALSWFERAAQLRPDLPPAIQGQGRALLALSRPGEALRAFERLQAVDPHTDMAPRGIGEALSQLGRIAEARIAFERATALAPDVAGHHYALAQAGRFVENDPRLAGLERLNRKIAALPPPSQCDLHFALGKAYDDLGRCEEAFAHWQAANAIKRKFVGYDEAMFLGILHDLKAAFPADVLAARRGAGYADETPVFVVGMPRSGTTLVEQILASHPDVYGAGESMHLHRLLGQGMAGQDFPARFCEVPDAALCRLGTQYVVHMRTAAPAAKRIVDKLTANFMLCGLIHAVLPRARIVHVRRDPRDTCFSCYANLFSQNFDYTYDLGELGRYYRAYEELMTHWRHILPAETFLEVRYEDVVADFETQSRRLVDFCGLQWNDACRDFHKTNRVVHTLSAAQVRQPLYKTSVGRWKPYAARLSPLFSALGISPRDE